MTDTPTFDATALIALHKARVAQASLDAARTARARMRAEIKSRAKRPRARCECCGWALAPLRPYGLAHDDTIWLCPNDAMALRSLFRDAVASRPQTREAVREALRLAAEGQIAGLSPSV